MDINRKQIKSLLEVHEFGELFNQLGWDWPESDSPYPVQIGEEVFKLDPIAFKRGFMAYHCSCLPDSATRAKIETKLSRDVREHLIVFTDEESGRQRWQWVRRVPGQPLSRKEHEYLPNQPMLLIEKIGYLEVDMDEEENIDLLDVFDKVKSAFDVDKVTKKFYDHFKKEHDAFLGFIDGITDMGDQNWYASVMLNRLMFIYFIQKKGFLEGDRDYLRNRLARVQELKGKGKFHTFYRYFMLTLCHEVLAKKERTLDKDLAALIGNVPYLNGGIFQPHELELEYGDAIDIPDEAFQEIFDFFDQYEWHLDNRPAANANEINPDVLGYIFEKYINQKQMGAYYTKEDITEYISKNTIIPCLFDKAQKACKIAFEGEASVWNLLKADPDRYIYPAVRHGVSHDMHTDAELEEPIPYPTEIETGLDTGKPDLLERRKKWNTRTPPEAGLPTEIWRETVARRQRYADVKGKLERGEVQSINELITLNLDIRQFAQDVIERCESPDLLNAFWTAIAGYVPTSGSNKKAVAAITVLDPTCGSGAFLFAALNILEPLYEACLERMKGFLEEWNVDATPSSRSGGTAASPSNRTAGFQPALQRDEGVASTKHPNYARFFQSIRDDIGNHPSPKYFIYKSIIIHNLYGVDIMKEAVEICKLRLFLKLVAQVEDGKKIEPLPDIDFNIRAGNTLVGFATEEEMKDFFDRDNGGQALLQFDSRLDEVKEAAEEVEIRFNLFRQCQLTLEEQDGKNPLPAAKQALQDELDDLNVCLNIYLAQDYGINIPSSTSNVPHPTFDKFLKSHQPFHWFIEFYGIIKSGGFDTIIGNPPYVEYSKVRKEYTVGGKLEPYASNLYATCTARSLQVLSRKGCISFIVPVSFPSTDRMMVLRKDLIKRGCYQVNFSTRPSKLFEGAEQRLTIFTSVPDLANQLFSAGYKKWSSEERSSLFQRISFIDASTSQIRNSIWPKFPDKICQNIVQKILNAGFLNEKNVLGKGVSLHYKNTGLRYFNTVTKTSPKCWINGEESHSSRETLLHVVPSNEEGLHCALISTAFFLYWETVSNCRDLNPSDLHFFGVPSTVFDDEGLKKLSNVVENDCFEKSKIIKMNNKKTGLVELQSLTTARSKPLIDEIDKVLAVHYGFTEEELDYIINYDIKYRMGKDLLENN